MSEISAFPKLTRVKFYASSHDKQVSGLSIAPGSVLILVGPNNSGKSQCLRDIESICLSRQRGPVVEDIDVRLPGDELTAMKLLNIVQANPPPGQVVPPGSVFVSGTGPVGGQTTSGFVQLEQFRQWVKRPDKAQLRAFLLPRFTLLLDVRTRFELVSDREAGDLQSPETNHLQALFRSDEARKKVQSLVHEAFGHYLLVDPTGMSTFRLKLGTEPPLSADFERSLTKEAIKFYSAASHINQFSDGVQAFVGLVAAAYALPQSVLLVDEPDAFLHPSLSRRIGEELTELAENRGGSLIVATHSAEFVLGCVETSDNVSIVRLTFDQKSATATELAPLEIKEMMQRPLLRSARILDALFHRVAVVTEGDADRAFYDEINRRLLANNRGIVDALFLSSFGIGQIPNIVSPLRRLGLPAAAILDLDFLTRHNAEWESLFKVTGIPESEWPTILETKGIVLGDLSKPNKDLNSELKKGLGSLQENEVSQAKSLVLSLKPYGIFLVEVGELEGWLKELEVPTGPGWTVRMFERLGDEGQHSVEVDQDDVWRFIDEIATWAHNPNWMGS